MSLDATTLDAWADLLADTARRAGEAIMAIYATDFEVMKKTDASPVTLADQTAEALILADLRRLEPAFPIVAEEDVAAHGAPVFEGRSFWLVDALDGTKDFIKKGDEFTVNIAFVHEGVPALGLVYLPVRQVLYRGVCLGAVRRAEKCDRGVRQQIACRKRPARVVVAGSKAHETSENMARFLAAHDVAERLKISSSMKFCLLAEGRVDLYPRFSPTSEWDTAAGHAIVRAAGGRVHDQSGTELAYKKPDFRNGRFLAECCA